MNKKTGIRVIRKGAHISHKASLKVSRYSKRIEHKATQVISGQSDVNLGKKNSITIDELIIQNLPQITPIKPMLPEAGRKPAVTLLLPTVNKNLFFGGVATAIITAALIAKKKNINLRVYSTFKNGYADIRAFLDDNKIDFKGEIRLSDISVVDNLKNRQIDIHPEDIFIVSAWPDAYMVHMLPLKNNFIYLVQDYEPIFFNNSDERVLAEQTYAYDNYVAFCNTKLMYDHLISMGHNNAKKGTWFEPAVSHKGKVARRIKPKNGKRKLFVYARPRVKRNLYFNALMALDEAFKSGDLNYDEWELFAAGQDDVPTIKLSSGIEINNLGKMSLNDYYRFTSTIDVALTPMMAPHPNYPTLELASVGAAVVTTKYHLKKNLDNYSKNIIMTEPDYLSMAKGIIEASKMSLDERVNNAQKDNINANWLQSLDQPVNKLIKLI